MYDNPLSGRIANSIVQLMVISGNYRWLLGLRPRPHQGGCSSPLDPRLLPGSMRSIDMAWPPGKYRFQRPLLKSSSGSKGCCGTGFRTLSPGTNLPQLRKAVHHSLAMAHSIWQVLLHLYAVYMEPSNVSVSPIWQVTFTVHGLQTPSVLLVCSSKLNC